MKKLLNLLLSLLLSNLLFSQGNWVPAGLPSYLYGANLSCLYVDTIENEMYIGGNILKAWYTWDDQCIVKYDGVNWDTLGSFDSKVQVIIKYNGNLIVGGWFSNVSGTHCENITMYDGNSWNNIGNLNAQVFNLRIIDNYLYVMGAFSKVDTLNVNGIAKWDGNQWSDVFGFPFYDPNVGDIAKYKGDFYVAGNFYDLGIDDMAVYKNNTWQQVGQGFFGGFNGINKLVVYKDELYAAGLIRKFDGNVGSGIQKWDGTVWTEPGTSLQDEYNTYNSNIQVHEMIIYNDELYICGGFDYAGHVPAFTLAKWNGSQWCGFGTTNVLTHLGSEIAFFNDTLYYTNGEDTLNGQFTNFLLKYEGTLQADTCSQSVGIDDQLSALGSYIHIYPNPNNGNFKINTNEINFSEIEFKLYNSLGKQVELLKIREREQCINVGYLNAGVFFYCVSKAEAIIKAGKIIIE